MTRLVHPPFPLSTPANILNDNARLDVVLFFSQKRLQPKLFRVHTPCAMSSSRKRSSRAKKPIVRDSDNEDEDDHVNEEKELKRHGTKRKRQDEVEDDNDNGDDKDPVDDASAEASDDENGRDKKEEETSQKPAKRSKTAHDSDKTVDQERTPTPASSGTADTSTTATAPAAAAATASSKKEDEDEPMKQSGENKKKPIDNGDDDENDSDQDKSHRHGRLNDGSLNGPVVSSKESKKSLVKRLAPGLSKFGDAVFILIVCCNKALVALYSRIDKNKHKTVKFDPIDPSDFNFNDSWTNLVEAPKHCSKLPVQRACSNQIGAIDMEQFKHDEIDTIHIVMCLCEQMLEFEKLCYNRHLDLEAVKTFLQYILSGKATVGLLAAQLCDSRKTEWTPNAAKLATSKESDPKRLQIVSNQRILSFGGILVNFSRKLVDLQDLIDFDKSGRQMLSVRQFEARVAQQTEIESDDGNLFNANATTVLEHLKTDAVHTAHYVHKTLTGKQIKIEFCGFDKAADVYSAYSPTGLVRAIKKVTVYCEILFDLWSSRATATKKDQRKLVSELQAFSKTKTVLRELSHLEW